jgi:outer membrane receptor for ferrienterochelin and colicins
MRLLLLTCTQLFICIAIFAQHTIRLTIKSSEEKTPLAGATATILSLNKSNVADSTGLIIFNNIAAGTYLIKISYVGLQEKKVSVQVPQPGNIIVEVLLEEDEEHDTEDVVVTATRISRSIANTPTRTEVISGEELAEKGNMKPGDIRMMLNESTGIQTQQTSATSFNAGIRIQGLDGRYTQILRDGYPLYAGFAGGLSLLQIAPLDLRQVEVIKGSASTLYGGGAIAGLVNLVSKTPGKNKELNFLTNVTSAGGIDLSGFYSQRYGKAGLTLFASRNSNAAFDPAGIGLTAIPKFERYTINPRLFIYGKNTTTDIGVSYITEDRTGGSMDYIKNGGSGFFEKNNTSRVTTQLGIAHRLSDKSTLQFKNSYTHFKRLITIPSYQFDAIQQSSFSELSWNRKEEKADWVIGINILTDDLNERNQAIDPERDYHYKTYGLFIQNAWSVTSKFTLETGLRGDYVNDYGFELMPRVSAMFKITPKLTTRIGGGLGYKTPTIFSEEAERLWFQNILPVNINTSKNEESVGGNWDINYSTTIGNVAVNFNHLFFYTRLNKPLVLMPTTGGKFEFLNSTGYLDTKGMETNLRLVYNDFKLFIGYTYTDANTHFTNTQQWLPLTARHRLNNVLMYEVEDKWKLGLEAYYYSRQQLNDGTFGKPYWITGFMAEKIWKKFSVFINFENFTDTRQTKFNTIYTGTINNPIFKDIYAPVDGFVVNGGVKLRL